MLLAKTKLNTIKVLIYKALINSYIIIHEEFVSLNNVLKDFNKTKEDIKNPKNAVEYYDIQKLCKRLLFKKQILI